MQIIKAPNPVLSKPTKRMAKIDKEILYLIKEMKETLLSTHDPEGVGLAAPQVGKSLQLFITRPTVKSPMTVFINPVINARGGSVEGLPTARTRSVPRPWRGETSGALAGRKPRQDPERDDKHTQLEGCLSLPSIWGEVARNPEVTLSYLDEFGKKHTKKFKGFLSTIIQHEYDHLNGVLFPKRVLEQKGKLYKSHKNKKGKDVFEPIEV